ncbi:hypothetical protein BGZ94_005801 [Podila epigama]|nr:hypothetical protein BGZ94_005801 [Podila epigama]
MKITSTIAAITLGAVAISSVAEAAVSAGCTAYLNTISSPSNPLSKCRTYTALGFPQLTHANDHDTAKLQKAINDLCATPACTPEQYAGVFKDLKANCAADMVAANQETLGATMYMWYLSPPQREAICIENEGKNGTCVVDSVSEMIARGQFPDENPRQDDLYGYLQYVTPMLSAKNTTNTAFCTSCNQQVANVFSNYYSKNPAPFPLNFAQDLNEGVLNTDLMYQYKAGCQAILGQDPSAFKPKPAPAAPKKEDNKSAATSALAQSTAGVVAATAAIAGLIALL